MSTVLDIVDSDNVIHRITVTSHSREDLPEGRTWLWKYEASDITDHDMVNGVILSSESFDEANRIFIDHLHRTTPHYNIPNYVGTKWIARIEGEDYFPEREDPILMTDYINA
jgi:hypothetical protein